MCSWTGQAALTSCRMWGLGGLGCAPVPGTLGVSPEWFSIWLGRLSDSHSRSTRFFFVLGLSSVAAADVLLAEPSRIRFPASRARLIANAYTSSRFTSIAVADILSVLLLVLVASGESRRILRKEG